MQVTVETQSHSVDETYDDQETQESVFIVENSSSEGDQEAEVALEASPRKSPRARLTEKVSHQS